MQRRLHIVLAFALVLAHGLYAQDSSDGLSGVSWASTPLFYARFANLESSAPVRYARYGDSVALLGDITGDGFTDFAIVEVGPRKVYVYSGDGYAELYSVSLPTASGSSALLAEALGDIDGDGLSDFAVGDVSNGEVYVLSGADGTLLYDIESPVAFIGFASALARLDDLDGDGIDDLAIGATGAEVDELPDDDRIGKVFVVSGVNGSPVYDLHSPDPGTPGEFGVSISAVSDVDGEGESGIAVGTTSRFRKDRGRVYLFGASSGAHIRTIPTPEPATSGSFGAHVEEVGDLDGDGAVDLVIGAPEEDIGKINYAGRAFAVSSATWDVVYAVESYLPGWSGAFGTVARSLGDIDGDGTPELAIGEPGAGRAHVLSGATGDPLKLLAGSRAFGYTIATLDPTAEGEVATLLIGDPEGRAGPDPDTGLLISEAGTAHIVSLYRGGASDDHAVLTPLLARGQGGFGSAVTVLGDISGDAEPDYLVGAGGVTSRNGENRAYLIDGATASVLRIITPPEGASARGFGSGLASTCDLDDDEVGDATVWADDGVGFGPGRVFVVSAATGDVVLTLNSPNAVEGGAFGASMTPVPDVDDDGRCDLLIGAPLESGAASSSGRAYLFSGETGALLRTLDTPSADPSGFFGSSVSPVGDLDGDGVTDHAVGAASDDGGRVYVFDGATGAHALTLAAPTPSSYEWFGAAVAGLSDINGDGAPEIAVGANGAPTMAYVFSGADGTLLYEVPPPHQDSDTIYGSPIVVVGDVSGDGLDDFAVSDPHAFGTPIPGAGAGRVYVHSGLDGALLATLSSPLEPGGESAGAFGRSLASAGGVLLVGAPSESAGNVHEAGRAYAFPLDAYVVSAERETPTASRDQTSFELYPNPAGESVSVMLELVEAGLVLVEAFDVLGRRVAVLHDGPLMAGRHPLMLDGSRLPAGLYVVRAEGEGLSVTRRVTILR